MQGEIPRLGFVASLRTTRQVNSAVEACYISRMISTAHDHVTVQLVDGGSVRAHARHLDDNARNIIEQRVNEALDVRAKRFIEPAALAALDRVNRTGTAWRKALRSGKLDPCPNTTKNCRIRHDVALACPRCA